jgi:thymidylate synthase
MSIINTIIINMRRKFKNADEAYNYFLDKILTDGINFGDTKALFNVGFTLEKPLENYIFNKERNWKPDYAEAEWQWYLSGDPNIKKLGQIYGKIPPIWERMADSQGNVMSNYGWQMYRNDQLNYVIAKLKNEKDTRHQYCFSMIQKLVADTLDIKVGEYYHYAHNLHLYNNKI